MAFTNVTLTLDAINGLTCRCVSDSGSEVQLKEMRVLMAQVSLLVSRLTGFYADRKTRFPLLLIMVTKRKHTKKEEAHCQLGEEDDGRLPGGCGLPGLPAGPRYLQILD